MQAFQYHIALGWATCIKEAYGIDPVFVHVDKDMAEISMAKEVTTPYNIQRAHIEFPFIDMTFIPPGRADAEEYEGGIPDDIESICPYPSPFLHERHHQHRNPLISPSRYLPSASHHLRHKNLSFHKSPKTAIMRRGYRMEPDVNFAQPFTASQLSRC